MKLLQHAMGQAKRLTSLRAVRLLLLAVIGTLIPTAAFADEGDVKLVFTSSDHMYLYASLALGVASILFAIWLRGTILKESPGSEKMQSVGLAIKEGAHAYLSQQVRTMIWFVAALAIGLFLLYYNKSGTQVAGGISFSFVCGVGASYIAGYAGMMTAVAGNMRTANAALTSFRRSLEIAFRSGAVAGMLTVGMGLIGATLILLYGGDSAMRLLIGFGFGGSLAALFMRVGGGIFTKAADVGADLVGKVEAGIPEDDPRNPATIADNVGDNVGDCAGMAADIFESYEVTLVAAIILGAATSQLFDTRTWMQLVLFALMARGVGIVASVIGIMMVKGTDDIDADPLMCIRSGFYKSAAIAAVATIALAYFMMGGSGKALINATKLTPAVAEVRHEYTVIQSVRDDIATTKKIPPYEVDPKDVVDDPRVKAMPGWTDPKDQTLAELIRQGTTPTPEPLGLTGFSKITNFEDSKNPVLSYVVIPQLPGDQPTQQNPTPAKYTVASLFGAKGSDQLVVAKLHIVQDSPGSPAQPATPTTPAVPAGPAQHSDQTIWFGPDKKGSIEKIVDQQNKQVLTGGNKVHITLEASEPVEAYSNSDNELAIAFPSNVDRIDRILQRYSEQQRSPGFAYYKMSSAELDKMQADKQKLAPTDPKASPPPVETTKIGIATQSTVPWYLFAIAVLFGILMAFAIEMLTDYYVSTHKRPVQEVAGVSNAGPAPMIIQGFAYAMESSVFMVFAIVIALLVPLYLFNPAIYGTYILSFYGIALVGLGLLTTTGFILAMDTFGPISDNAQGVYEMSGEGHDNILGTKAVQRLDAAGNTTKALTKGFAIATAVVAAVALFHSFLESAKLETIGLRLDVPEIFLGMLIGAAAPYLFSASTINAVGRASFQLINEVRRQFREDAGIMAGTSKPDYGRCVAIVTAAAQKELLGPGILAICLPLAVAFGFSIGKAPTIIDGHPFNLTGAQALGGFLAGAIASGQLLAVLLANSGGMWDNSKKLIEDGLYGGKGSDAHKAGVVVDTVGDPFKDTAGPALNPLIKVMNLVALLLAATIIQPLPDSTLILVTVVAVGLLAISIFISKKGSMSSEMAKATSGATEIAEHHSLEAPALDESPTPKKRITVEEPLEAPLEHEHDPDES